ncbi:hypothetical protein F8M41_011329 [Gigaspora margarita]|uniref:Uncharacterized protein n=1 Tax=Gigaspora margarita TaxID=4874 RepID=A0A8H4ATU0_GIGMA|nr:hypothetical protein F8M41_011329 [Gigaspora margarita]
MEIVRSALDCYSVESSLPYKFKTNKPNKLLVICPTSETSTCPFTISANKRKDGYIHIFTAPLVDDIVAIQPHDIMNRVRSEVGAEASYMGAWRSKAANKKYGKMKSITAFEIDAENRFNRVFLCLHPWIQATEHCKSIFTFDACHSKSSYKGVYLGVSTIEDEGKLIPALHVEDFENIMKDIFKLHTEAAIYLNEIPPETWTLSKWPEINLVTLHPTHQSPLILGY